MEELRKKAKNILEKIPHISIASVTPEGNPWNTPVFAAHDEKYNFFWNSSTISQHSKNIKFKNDIFFVVYDSSGAEGSGVYFQAKAVELGEESELEYALKVFYLKKGKEPKLASEFLGTNSQRFYKATPIKCWMNDYDRTRVPVDSKIEIDLWNSTSQK